MKKKLSSGDTMEQLIRDFFYASLKKNFNDFDFDEFFDEFLPLLDDNLIRNAQLSFEEYFDWCDGVFDKSSLSEFTFETIYTNITVDEVFEAIMRLHYNRLQESLKGKFTTLLSLRTKLQTTSNLSPGDRILLVDECIHAQHVSGFIIDDCNPDDIREQVEAEWRGEA